MVPVPPAWRPVPVPVPVPVPLLLWEPWARHGVLLAGMVASHGLPGMCVAAPGGIWVASLDWTLPGGPPGEFPGP
jgi:hypothetical protein